MLRKKCKIHYYLQFKEKISDHIVLIYLPVEQVENFTVSFSDGRALCCLVHHYHPGLLPLTKIQFQTMQSFQEAAEVSGDQGDSDVSMEWPSGTVFGGGPFHHACWVERVFNHTKFWHCIITPCSINFLKIVFVVLHLNFEIDKTSCTVMFSSGKSAYFKNRVHSSS